MRKTAIVLCVVLALALSLGACGKSKKKAKATTTTSESTTSTTTTAPLVATKADAKFGTILADDKGMTLYTLTSAGAAVTCDATCAAVWPPLELPSGASAPTSTPDVTGLGTTAGPNGTTIVTHDGLPLYRFSRDQTPADALGEGIQSFGGVWHVVKIVTVSTTTTAAGRRSGGTTRTTARPATVTTVTPTTLRTTTTAAHTTTTRFASGY
jgi:predicted lipoprotein with Yx(FWY)xxD motif